MTVGVLDNKRGEKRKLLRETFPRLVHWKAQSSLWQQDHFISWSEQMVGVQQAAYVPMSRGHSYRWRVGRRQALKHNLTFPPHLELHCYESQREISPHQWIAAPNLFKGKLLTVLCISPLPLLNQAAGLAVFHAVGKARGGSLRSLWPIYSSLRNSDIFKEVGLSLGG